MKIIKNFIVLALLFPVTAAMAMEDYTIDPMHSHVLWHISHFDFSHPSGKWMVTGDIEWDKDNIPNSKVKVNVKIEDVITGIKKLDKHIASKDFLDADKFPTATFVSNKIDAVSKQKFKIHGILTVHGVSKPITLDATFNKTGLSPVNNKETIGFTAKTVLKRSDFGVSAYLPGLGDKVDIDIEVEANKAK